MTLGFFKNSLKITVILFFPQIAYSADDFPENFALHLQKLTVRQDELIAEPQLILPETDIVHDFQSINSLVENKNFEEAAALCRKLIKTEQSSNSNETVTELILHLSALSLNHDIAFDKNDQDLLQKVAETGETKAMYHLSLLLSREKNSTESLYWLRKASTLGHQNGIDDLMYLLCKNPDTPLEPEDIALIDKMLTAEQIPSTWHHLSVLLNREKRFKEAADCFRKLLKTEQSSNSNKTVTNSILSLAALSLSHDIAFDKNDQDLLQKVAETGETKAMYYLGCLFIREKNTTEALYWLRKASTLGFKNSAGQLIILFATNPDIPLEQEDTALIDKMLTAEQTPSTWHNLGILLKQEKRVEEAADCFRKASKSGDSIIINNLITFLIENHMFISEVEKTLLKPLAEQGNVDAMINLGTVLEIEKNFEESLKWFEKSLNLAPNLPQVLRDNIQQKITRFKKNIKAASNVQKPISQTYSPKLEDLNEVFLKAQQLDKNGNFAEAKKLYEQGAKKGDSNSMRALGRHFARIKDFKLADTWLQKALETGMTLEEIGYDLASLAIQQDKPINETIVTWLKSSGKEETRKKIEEEKQIRVLQKKEEEEKRAKIARELLEQDKPKSKNKTAGKVKGKLVKTNAEPIASSSSSPIDAINEARKLEELKRDAKKEGRKAENVRKEKEVLLAKEVRKAEEEAARVAAEKARKAKEEATRVAAEKARKAEEKAARILKQADMEREARIAQTNRIIEEGRKAQEEAARVAAEIELARIVEQARLVVEKEEARKEEARKAIEENRITSLFQQASLLMNGSLSDKEKALNQFLVISNDGLTPLHARANLFAAQLLINKNDKNSTDEALKLLGIAEVLGDSKTSRFASYAIGITLKNQLLSHTSIAFSPVKNSHEQMIFNYFNKAANLGHRDSMYEMGLMLKNGYNDGTSGNRLDKALKFFLQAVQLNHLPSANEAALIIRSGTPTRIPNTRLAYQIIVKSKIISMYQQIQKMIGATISAPIELSNAAYTTGLIHAGLHWPNFPNAYDEDKAFLAFQLGAQLGHKDSQFEYALRLFSGTPAQQNEAERLLTNLNETGYHTKPYLKTLKEKMQQISQR